MTETITDRVHDGTGSSVLVAVNALALKRLKLSRRDRASAPPT